MTRLALLCWEFGEGLGHVAGLLQIARVLRRRGWTCEFALPRGSMAARFLPRGTVMRAAPEWRKALPSAFVYTRSTASMADMLADLGLRSAEGTRAQITQWQLAFASGGMPDLVVADSAPGALLAARGRFPSVAVGTGFSVPPSGLKRFPTFDEAVAPRDDEEAVLATVNAVLATFGNPPLAYLSDALRGDAALACTLPALDPYAGERRHAVHGPLLARRIALRESGEGDAIVCYFDPGRYRRRVHKLAECLRGLAWPCIAFVPNITEEEERALSDAQVEVAGSALGADALARAGILVHAGEHGMAAAAVLAGIPQVILDLDIEQEMIGAALANRGVGRRIGLDVATAEEIRQVISSAAADANLKHAALGLAAENAAYVNVDAAERVADSCDSLVS